MFGRSCACFVVVAVVGSGCSALVSPDEGLLDPASGADAGSGVDAGPLSRTDGGPGSGTDGGPGVDSGPDVDGGPPVCEGPPSCAGGVLTFCEEGVTRTHECPLGCAESGDRCGEFVPSNVEPGLWRADAADVRLEGGSFVLDTSACTSVMATTEVVPQEDGPELCVLQVGTLRIAEGSRLGVTGARPLVILATEDVVIDGTLDVSAHHIEPGPGGFWGGWRDVIDGLGVGGGGGGVHEAGFDDGGGGGGGLCGAGGDGGRGGTAAGGAGGGTVSGGWELVPLFGGSGGGRGRGRFSASGATNAGLGGAGGGAIQISALGAIRIGAGGAVLAGGGGGLGGSNRLGYANWGSGGGGGSGGAVLLESPSVRIDGHVNVAGGGGGGGATGLGDGGDGQNGLEALDGRAAAGFPPDSSRGAPGGESGGGTEPDGVDGGAIDRDGANGGGGGGGAGCILVRTADGTVDGTPRPNPSVAPSWRTARVRVR